MLYSPNAQIKQFSQLVHQIITYLQQRDQGSLEFLLEDEDQFKLQQIKKNLTPSQLQYFNTIINKIQSVQKIEFLLPSKAKAILQDNEQERSQGELQNIQKQYKINGILYAEDYSYPYLDLIQKMVMVYFRKSHANPFPESSLKMLHSQIQTLFTQIFNLKQNQITPSSKKTISKKSVINSLKEYLFYIFEPEYQKFYNFNKFFEKIRKQTSKDTEQNSQILQKKDQINTSPLTSTENKDQFDYILKISEQINNKTEFGYFTRIKSLNFLYFGEQRLKQLIDPNGSVLPSSSPKQLYQLISFIICRFLRKVVLNSIRRKKNGKLQYLKNNEHIQSIHVKMSGNQLIEKASKKAEEFIKLDESVEKIANRTFIKEFYEYDYETVIPKEIIQRSEKYIATLQQNCKISVSEYIWSNYKQYRNLWIQRITGEMYEYQRSISIQSEKNNQSYNKLNRKQKGHLNQYSKFIQKNANQYEKSPSLVWVKYLTMNHFSEQLVEEEKKYSGMKLMSQSGQNGKKRVKLQSLKS